MRPEQERVKKLLTEAVTLLCRNSLQYEEEVTVEGLIGITLDQRDIFLVSIRETVENAFAVEARKRKAEEDAAAAAERPESPKRKRDRKRRSSRDSASPPASPRVRTKEEPSGLLMDVEEATDDQVVVKKERVEGPADGTDSHTTNQNDDNAQRTDPESDQDQKGWHHDQTASQDTPQNPAHRQGQNHDRTGNSNSFTGPYTTPHPPPNRLRPPDTQHVNVKQEDEGEEDACFVIDSDDEDLASDSSRSNPLPQFLPNLADTQLVPTQGWPGGGGGGGEGASNFDPDLLATAQQFGSQKGTPQGWPAGFDVSQLSQMSGGSGDAGSMSFMANASPGSSRQFQMAAEAMGQSADGQQRDSAVCCSVCGHTFRSRSGLGQHIRLVHQKIRPHGCRFCHKRFTQKYYKNHHELRCKARHPRYEGTAVRETGQTEVEDLTVTNDESNIVYTA